MAVKHFELKLKNKNKPKSMYYFLVAIQRNFADTGFYIILG